MKLVNVNVDYMQVFVIINNFGTMVNGDANVDNWLKKVIKDLFGIVAIVNVNVMNRDVGEYLDYENCKSRINKWTK